MAEEDQISLISELALQLGFVPMDMVEQMITEALDQQQMALIEALSMDDEGEGETDSHSDIDPGFYQGSGDGSDIDPGFSIGDPNGGDAIDPGFSRPMSAFG